MFTFLIDAACKSTTSHIFVETVATDADFVELQGSELNNNMEVAGYRVWIPLQVCSAYTMNKAVEEAVSGAEDDVISERTGAKRRAVEPERTAPLFRRKVGSPGELLSLLRLYFGGKSWLDNVALDTIDIENTEETLSAGDEVGGSLGPKRTLVEVMAAEDQFKSVQFRQRCETWKPYSHQRDFDSYVDITANGDLTFWPRNEIRTSGLMRQITIGAGSASIIRCGTDIYRYLLPHMSPGIDDLKRAIERASMATGVRVDVSSAKTITDLVKVSQEMENDEALWCDPFWYSVITLPATVDSTCLDGSFHEVIKSQVYHTVESLRDKNQGRLTHAAAAGRVDTVVDLYHKITRDSDTLYSVGKVDGVPTSLQQTTQRAQAFDAHRRR